MADIIIEEMGEGYEGEDLQVTPINDTPIYIEISGLKGIDRFIGLQDTPIYYDNGKFFKVQDNKIVYTDIQWNDIEGDITSNKDFIEELNRLIIESTEEYTLQNINNGIFLHNNNSDSHPYILSTISSNYNTLDTKIDTTKEELVDVLSDNYITLDTKIDSVNKEITNNLNSNYTTLDTKIDDTKEELIEDISELDSKVDSNYVTLDTKIDNTKTELTNSINSNYTTLDTKIDNNKNELDGTISNLSDKVDSNYTTLDTKINNNKNELDGTISELTEVVSSNYTTLDTKINNTKTELTNSINSNYTTLDTKIDNTKNDLNKSIEQLDTKVDSNYITLDTKIDNTKTELNTNISNLTQQVNSNYTTIDTKIDGAKTELNTSISQLSNTVNENYITLNTNKANKATTLQGYGIVDAYTKQEVDAKTAKLYEFKGNVNTYEDLPTENLSVGDTYNILSTGANYAWDGESWDNLSGIVDISHLLSKEDAIKTYDTIESVDNKILSLGTASNTALQSLDAKIDSTKTELQNNISGLSNSKQDKLTSGDGITIENNTISGTKVVVKFWN